MCTSNLSVQIRCTNNTLTHQLHSRCRRHNRSTSFRHNHSHSTNLLICHNSQSGHCCKGNQQKRTKVSISQPDQSKQSSAKPCLHASACTNNGLKCQHRLHPYKSARHHLSWNKHALHPRCDPATCPVFDVNGEVLLCMVRVCQAAQHAVSEGHNSTLFDVLQQTTYTDRAEAIQYILSTESAVETYFAQKYRGNKQAGTVKKEMSAQMNEFLTTLGLSVFVHANRDMGYYAVQTIRFGKNGVKRHPASQTSPSLSTTTTTVDPTLAVDITIQSTDSTSNLVDVT